MWCGCKKLLILCLVCCGQRTGASYGCSEADPGGQERSAIPPVRMTGMATVYSVGDGNGGGGPMACQKTALAIYGENEHRDDLMVIAVRNKQREPVCGREVLVENPRTEKVTWARRLDSGPYGCYSTAGKRTVAKRCPSGFVRKSDIDITEAVKKATGHNGMEVLNLRW